MANFIIAIPSTVEAFFLTIKWFYRLDLENPNDFEEPFLVFLIIGCAVPHLIVTIVKDVLMLSELFIDTYIPLWRWDFFLLRSDFGKDHMWELGIDAFEILAIAFGMQVKYFIVVYYPEFKHMLIYDWVLYNPKTQKTMPNPAEVVETGKDSNTIKN